MATKVETELLKATEISVKKSEPRQKFLHRLVDAVQDLDDDDWKALSTEAQEWVNAGASAIKSDGEDAKIADFSAPADDEEPEEDQAAEPDEDEDAGDEPEDEDETMPAKKAKKPAKAKVAKPAPKAKEAKAEKKAAPEKKNSGPKPTGIKVQIKKIVFKNPSVSVDEIMDKLGKDGVKPSKQTISAIRSEFRHSLYVLRDVGALKADPAL